MLSSILNSPRAIQVNIAIMRAFVQSRRITETHADLFRRLESPEEKRDARFRVLFEAIRQLINPPSPLRQQIGF